MTARRSLLALGSAAIAAPSLPSLAAPSPDAALLGWCRRWTETEEEYSAANAPYADTMLDPTPEVTALLCALYDEGCDMLDRVAGTPALTEAGRRAKASVVQRIVIDTGGNDFSDAITASLIRDVLAGDPRLAAMDQVASARRALAEESGRSREEGEEYRRLNGLARIAEEEMAKVWRAMA